MKNAKKIIALSLLALASSPSWAGLGSLQVQSALGEPFAGSITVNGDEAIALQQGRFSLSGAPLQTKISRHEHTAVIYLRSLKPIHDPLFSFNLQVGNQARQYTALLDPPADKNADSSTHDAAVDKAVKGGHTYQVGSHENLIDVARQVQPHGLNLAQTMRALVAANPRAFRNHNPDFMYRNVKLRIPSDKEMRELAKARPKEKIRTRNSTSVTKPVANNSITQKVNAADADQNHIADMAASVVSMAPPETVKPETVKEEVAAAATAATASLENMASDAASAASEVKTEAASAVQPVAEVKPKPVVSQPVETTDTADSNDWMRYAMIGGGVAVLLLLALVLWQRYRKRQNEADEDDDDLDDDSVMILDDADEHNLPAEQLSEAKKPVAESKEQVSTAPKSDMAQEANGDDDWAWLENANISQDISEPNKTQPVEPAEVENQTVEAPADNEISPVISTQKQEDNDDWLNFNFDPIDDQAGDQAQNQNIDDLAATTAAEQQPQPAVTNQTQETEEEKIDLDWLNEVDAQADEIPQTSYQPQNEPEIDDSEWMVAEEPEAEDIKSLDSPQIAATEISEEKPTTTSYSDDTDWGDLNFDDQSAGLDTPVATAKDEPAVNTVPKTDNEGDIDWSAWGGLDDTEQTNSATETPAPEAETPVSTSASEIEFVSDDDNFDFDFDETTISTSASTSPFTTGHVEYNDTKPEPVKPEKQEKQLSASEMSIPLQAKLELAQMYLEMDDAVTARQTLRELLDEANGEVLAKAQELLHQLGG